MKIDFVLKWLATATLIIGAAINGLGYYPVGPLILAAGGCIWLIVAIMWREWSLILTNAVMTSVGLLGLAYTYFNSSGL